MNSPRSSQIPTRPSAHGNSRTTWIVGGAVALVVVVAGIVALVSTSGDDDADADAVVEVTEVSAAADPTTSVLTTEAGAGPVAPTDVPATTPATAAPTLQETQPVTVTGAQLPVLSEGKALGATAPTISGASFDGTPITIGPGRPTLVVFLAHWCPHCQTEASALVQWAKAGEAPAGLDVIGVATATTAQRDNYPPSEWLAREGWPWPVMADSSSADALFAMGGDAFPFFVLLDADGTVVARESGELDPSDLSDAIAEALG